MIKISRLTVKNFRSLKHIENFELHDLNIFIGQNGSGKSNLIKFIEMLRHAADKKLGEAINLMGGFDLVRHFNAFLDEPISWEIEFKDMLGVEQGVPCFYATELSPRGKSGNYVITSEEAWRPPYPKYANVFKYLSVTNGIVRISSRKTRIEKNTEPDEELETSDSELAISQVRYQARYPVLYALREMLADWVTFRGFGSDALENIHQSQPFFVTQPLRLESLGTNLVSIFQQLANDPAYESTYQQLTTVLQAAFDDLERIDTPVAANGRGVLTYRSKYFKGKAIPAQLVSDGQLRFLGLAILLLLPDPPPLIAIDEPEIGLHPRLLPLLADLLKQASSRTQIVVTTHSPQLLDAEAIDPSDVVIVERENGDTNFERPNQERLERWLKHYSLGELWVRGPLTTLGT